MSSFPSAVARQPVVSPQGGLATLLKGRRLFVVSNRGPVTYHLEGDRLEPRPASGGLATALSTVASHTPLTWIAAASSSGDRMVGGRSVRRRNPGSPRVRFVIAPDDAYNWFYHHFANPVLWLMQHGLWSLIRRKDLREMVERGWMMGYRPVNEAFAKVVGEEVEGVDRPVILTHDYHLYLLPRLLRKRVPGALLQHFVHIPWPEPEVWEPLLPAIRREMCAGLLGADIVGFQTDAAAGAFLRCCDAFVPGVRVDYGRSRVWMDGRATDVRSYPISVDPDGLRRLSKSAEVAAYREKLRPLLGHRTVVRVDRLDPSKNVALGFRAFGRMLERRPDLRGRVGFLAFLIPTRQGIPEYRAYAQEVWRAVDAVNDRFGRDDWKPIIAFHEDDRAQAMAGMSLADVLLVNPVADGMNLVAKEGPIVSEKGMALVLSRNCGAHQQLGYAALSIPPHDEEATASALERAVEMPVSERMRRTAALRESIVSEDLSWWMDRQFEDLAGRAVG